MTDIEVIEKMVDGLIDSFIEKTPKEIMLKTTAPLLMYNAVIRLLNRMCSVCGISKETLKKHIDEFWSAADTTNKKIYN